MNRMDFVLSADNSRETPLELVCYVSFPKLVVTMKAWEYWRLNSTFLMFFACLNQEVDNAHMLT
jgi:hypothetical protein